MLQAPFPWNELPPSPLDLKLEALSMSDRAAFQRIGTYLDEMDELLDINFLSEHNEQDKLKRMARLFRAKTVLEPGNLAALSIRISAHGYGTEWLLLYPDRDSCLWSIAGDFLEPKQSLRRDIPLEMIEFENLGRCLLQEDLPDFWRGRERPWYITYCSQDHFYIFPYFDNPACQEWLKTRKIGALQRLILLFQQDMNQ